MAGKRAVSRASKQTKKAIPGLEDLWDPKDFKYIDYSVKRNVAWLTMNEPARLNPLRLQRAVELREAIRVAENDDDVVLICFAAKGPHFSGGAEINPYTWGTGLQFFNSHMDFHRRLWDQIWHSKKPICAAIHGYTIGFTLETVLRCDMIIATEDTKLAYLEIQFASPYGNQKMGRLSSEKIQMWYSLTGDVMTAQEAERKDIINKIVPNDKLEDAVYELCDKLKRWSPTCLWFNRLAIKYGNNVDERTGVFIEDALESLHSTTADWAEGLEAFQARPRRKPVFTSKIPKGIPESQFGPKDKKPILDLKQQSFIFEPGVPRRLNED